METSRLSCGRKDPAVRHSFWYPTRIQFPDISWISSIIYEHRQLEGLKNGTDQKTAYSLLQNLDY